MGHNLNYNEARKLIDNGDLVSIRTSHGIMGNLTKYFTRSDYTHCGIAIWIEGGLYIGELNGGRNHLTPLSQYENAEFDVFYPPRGLKSDTIKDSVMKKLRSQIDYGYLAFVAIGITEWLKLKAYPNWRNTLVCSSWCITVYEDAGWSKQSHLISPGGLSKMLDLKLSVG